MANLYVIRADGTTFAVTPSSGITAISDAGAVTLGGTPSFTTLVDTNGNEEIKFTTTASAVNEITIANAATGGRPTISATGGDTDIDIAITGKGAGGVYLQAGAISLSTIATFGVPIDATGFTITAGTLTCNGTATFGNGGSATAILASNLSGGTDPTITFGNALVTISTALTVSNDVTSTGAVQSGGANLIGWSARSRMYSPADGQIRLTNAATNGFTILQFGSTTSSFPAFNITTGTQTIMAGLADGSAGGTFSASGSLLVATHTPASAAAAGVAGRIAWDADYIYICTATNTWKRVAIATWP